MIFVTVGHQMPFDRLVRAVDAWAKIHNRRDVFAQIGRASYAPTSFPSSSFLSPREFEKRMDEATAIVGHAGTGTIIAALQRGKPLLVMPRLARFQETRNDHQIATAKYFGHSGRVLVAASEDEIQSKLAELATFRPRAGISSSAAPELIARLRAFVDQ